MKKGISIIIVLMLVFNSAGYVLTYFELKYFFKKEAFGRLDNYIPGDDLTVINISRQNYENNNEDFYFVDDNEIKFFGKLYDISKVEITGDSVEIVCLSDENESKLDEIFELFFYHNINDKFSKTASSNILKNLITDAGLPNEFTSGLSWREDKCFIFIFVPILNNFYDVPTPPPKNIV